MNWRPSASNQTLRNRAAFLASTREFMRQRQVLEVDPPALGASTITDVHLEALTTEVVSPHDPQKRDTYYLQTSPEYYMKRLLAAGIGDIFYLGKCYRDDEHSRLHSPEFTMLEWYRCQYSMQDLIDEVIQLVEFLTGLRTQQITYQEAFQQVLSFDPLTLVESDIKQLIDKHDLSDYLSNFTSTSMSIDAAKDALLQVLFNRYIEPKISANRAMIVTHFPASQASLAKLSDDGLTALRFELYINGCEIANGFEELTDATQQRQRFEHDNQLREALAKPKKPIDEQLLAALESGLPDCSGIALGIDRLFMAEQAASHIAEVMPFSVVKLSA